ncbi:MAG TPA: DUF6152 family protein [Gammaproteobacteria bacterium]|nr:DUF6152 family protein [Gammaproteobacteria bacterium]
MKLPYAHWLLCAFALCGASSALAHHSVAFYSPDKIELAGEITSIQWQNPHIRFELRTVGAGGVPKVWQLESSSIFLREKDGVTRDLFHVGDAVRVYGRPSPHDASALLVTNMLLPDGREAPLWPQTPPHFVGMDRWITTTPTLVDAAAENRGIFRVWRPNQQASLAALPYTEAAVAARRSFDMLAAATRCGPEGMPRIMMTLFPYEFVDRGTELLVRTELYDTERVIHMDRTAPPPGEPHSVLGYSVGAWQGDVLVIDTSLVNWPYLDQIGTPLSEDVQVVERYALSDDQTRLDVEITITDAGTFTGPAVVKNSWFAYGDTLRRYDCQNGD